MTLLVGPQLKYAHVCITYTVLCYILISSTCLRRTYIYIRTYVRITLPTSIEHQCVLLHEVPTIRMLYPHCAKRRTSATRKSTGQEEET